MQRFAADAEIIRSRRKSAALQISDEGKLIVRVPLWYSDREISEMIEKNRKWIEVHTAAAMKRNSELEKLEPFTADELEEMARKALRVIPEKVRYYAEKLGVTYGRITIRNQKTRWGSCTAKGNLNFNCLLMAVPEEVLDSVVVHELCHRLHMDHSKAFYEDVYRVFPEYDRCNKWLKENGKLLIGRMLAGMKEK
ncbi:MAG: M48 family metallopeptidase [Ruminococcus sp.]|nr:M48 family metallopeptidase [Ruminococcus sp.]